MSKIKHKAFRRVLNKQFQIVTVGEFKLNVKIITWCIVDSETSRTFKTSHIGFSCYINNNVKERSVEARFLKNVSIKNNNPMSSKIFETLNLKRIHNEAFSKAFSKFESTLSGLTARVLFFYKNSGEGMIKCDQTDKTYMIYACNLKGHKTWYPETACVYLNEGDKIDFKLSSGIVVARDHGHFDSEKWNSLDQSKLAFKCNEEGEAINGLFS